MELTLNYEARNFFNWMEPRSDKTNATLEKLEKAWNFFKKNYNATIWLNPVKETYYCFSWASLSAFENSEVTISYSPKWNIREYQKTNSRRAHKIAKEILENSFVWGIDKI